jgi:hypothetical protein
VKIFLVFELVAKAPERILGMAGVLLSGMVVKRWRLEDGVGTCIFAAKALCCTSLTEQWNLT